MRYFVLLVCLSALLAAEIPPAILAERDVPKRAELALKQADENVSAAAKAYAGASDLKDFEAHVGAVGELTEFTLKSLRDSAMRGGKRVKHFKRAEFKMNSLLRRLDTLEKEVSAEDRPPVTKVRDLVSEALDHIRHDILVKR